MNNKKEVVDRLNELRTHARECWGFVWKNDENRQFASEEAASFEESFHYFKEDHFCLWDINTYRKAEEIDSINPFFDDNGKRMMTGLAICIFLSEAVQSC